jgi:hypothetical protein
MSTPLDVVATAAVRDTTDPRLRRRAALWALLGGGAVGGIGVGWDVRWHLVVGRDSFWIPPHVMIYASVAAAALVSLGVLVAETLAARGGRPTAGAVGVLGLVGSPGLHLAWWGLTLTLLAAPIDDVWHRLFGLDVTIWSPPHLLGFAGAAVHGLGCLRIALEAWPPGRRARTLAVALGGVLMLADFQILAGPALQTAYRHGGPFFFAYAVVGGALFAFALVLPARLSDEPALPVAVALGAVALQLATLAAADVGFAVLQPASAIRDAVAADPGSPIAVAWEMARRSGESQPGRGMQLRIALVVPAAVMALLGVRRRPRLGGIAFGVAFLLVSSVVLARSPAFAEVRPSLADAAIGAPIAVLAALGGALVASRVAARLRVGS